MVSFGGDVEPKENAAMPYVPCRQRTTYIKRGLEHFKLNHATHAR